MFVDSYWQSWFMAAAQEIQAAQASGQAERVAATMSRLNGQSMEYCRERAIAAIIHKHAAAAEMAASSAGSQS